MNDWNVAEKTYWNACPVRNNGSVIYLLPKGNTSLLSGFCLYEIGLVSYEVDGAAVATPHDESLQRRFLLEPGRLQTEFDNFVRPFLRVTEEVAATGNDSFILRYTWKSRANEPKFLSARFRVVSDRPAKSASVHEDEIRMMFDLGDKMNNPGAGFYDFSELREWFMENRYLDLSIKFPKVSPTLAHHALIRDGKSEIIRTGAECILTGDITPHGTLTWEIHLNFGKEKHPGLMINAVTRNWHEFASHIPQPQFLNDQERFAYYKCWSVLFSNEVKRKGIHWCLTGLLFPSVWVWDTSPFIVSAYLPMDSLFTQKMVSAQLDSIKTSGMMPLHVIEGLVHREERRDEITQIPLVADSAWKVFQKTQDYVFAQKAYHALQKNYDWFERKRKPDPDIPLWGIDDRRAPYHYGPESGMDNNPIYDAGPAYSVAINSAKFSFEQAMQHLAIALELNQEADQWKQRMSLTREFILEKMWDETAGFYFPLRYSMERIRIKTGDAFVGLFLGIYPDDRVKRMARTLQEEFLTEYGVTVVSMREECFDPNNYARGAVWPFMNYMVDHGLRKAGISQLPEDIFVGTLRTLKQFPNAFECYNPVEKKLGHLKDGPVCFPCMSFSAAGFISMILERRPPVGE